VGFFKDLGDAGRIWRKANVRAYRQTKPMSTKDLRKLEGTWVPRRKRGKNGR
jgi:hypothetical protein